MSPSLPNQASTVSAPSEQSAWIDEVRAHEPAIRGYLRSEFPSMDADDIVQESYLRVLRAKAGGRILSARAYFFTVARNTARRLFHRSKIYSDVPVNELPDWRVLDGGSDAAEVTHSNLRRELAVEAIDQLPARCREIFRMAALERLPPVEIAARLKLSENTVYVQIARGVKRCAEYLNAQEKQR